MAETETSSSNLSGPSLDELAADNPGTMDDMDSADFFSELDKSVNAVTYGPGELEQESQPVVTNAVQEAPVEESAPADDYKTLEKRYSDSSSEAKRLNNRITEIEPYMPILDAMREDPNLVSHVRNYFEGGGTAPVSVKEQLGLDEDFTFDYDEAITDPSSSSAKILNHTVDGVVQRRLSEFSSQTAATNARAQKENDFRAKFEISDNDFEDMKGYAKEHVLSYEDVWYLMNRGSEKKNIENSVREDIAEQMKTVRSKPRSMAAAGSHAGISTKSPDDAVFDAILSTGQGIGDIMSRADKQ